jgi:serine/threonine-protein kinase
VYPRISSDGSQVALDVRDQERDIWVWHFERATLARVTKGPAPDIAPLWMPDGKRIIFSTSGPGEDKLFWQAADGTGNAERLSEGSSRHLPTSISPDGTRVFFTDQEPSGEYDVGMLHLAGDRRIDPITQTPFDEMNASVSPDSRVFAYQSNESGRHEIYLRPFPDVHGARHLVSTGGGTQPVWARSGRELFYFAMGTGALMAVSIQTTPVLTIGTPTRLFGGGYFSELNLATYDVSPDGQRFLMIKEETSAAGLAPRIIVVENWFDELERRVPAN